MKIPRKALSTPIYRITLHGFCDVGELAYGACIYARSVVDSTGSHTINLLCSKSSIAPLKVVSFSNLEFCGAMLLTQLMQKAIQCLHLNKNSLYFWTDSTIILAWITAAPKTWGTLVANRVSEIQKLTDRRRPRSPLIFCTPEELISSQLWWSGPEWLQDNFFDKQEGCFKVARERKL